jgi:hypothetical protein
MLTKTVLCAAAGGECKLIEVPFTWRHGEPIPADALERQFPSAGEALSELAARGRLQARVHIDKPARRVTNAAADGSNATPPEGIGRSGQT